MSSRRVSSSKAGAGGGQALPSNVVGSLLSSYRQSTPLRHKIIDAFLVFNMIAGILIFAHGILVTTFPFDSWIAS